MELNKREDATFTPIDKDLGDLYTLDKWKEMVRGGGFMDHDGYGEYSDGTNLARIIVLPSDYRDPSCFNFISSNSAEAQGVPRA